jgi:bifunctional non-homologous end joining protein LigD
MLWDRGFWAVDGYPEKALRKGELRFTLVGDKLQGAWVLVRLRKDREGGKRTNWLLIKRHDGHEQQDLDILEQDRSVASGRAMDEIASGKGRTPEPFMLGKSRGFGANAVWRSSRRKDEASLKPATKPTRKRGRVWPCRSSPRRNFAKA